MAAIDKANPDVLSNIFGDAVWTNKNRLTDENLLALIDHFSAHTLSVAQVAEDQLGNAYEYLIKKFADDSGHTAAEFYTNRTVVRLMTLLMDPKPGESIYDPTCGSGGLLLNAALQLKKAWQEYRTLKIYGQEINLITSSIARMNLFLHGILDFRIAWGNTLSQPSLLEHDHLRQFDVVMANPPYSIKQWDQKAFQHDAWGRNLWVRRRRAVPTTHFSSTFTRARSLKRAARWCCTRTGCCFGIVRPTSGVTCWPPT